MPTPTKLVQALAAIAPQAVEPSTPQFSRDQALLDAVTIQRNEAFNALATANANLAVAAAAIHEQDAKIADLERQLKAFKEPDAKMVQAQVAAAH